MSLAKINTYLLSTSDTKLDQTINDLITSKLDFQFLNPIELGGQWSDVYLNDFEPAEENLNDIKILNQALSTRKAKGLFSAFLDNRIKIGQEEVLASKDSLETRLDIAKYINEYTRLDNLENELTGFVKKNFKAGKLLLVEYIETIEQDFATYIEGIISEVKSKKVDFEIPEVVPDIVTNQLGDYTTVQMAEDDYELVKEFLSKTYPQKTVYEPKDLAIEITRQKTTVASSLEDLHININNLSELVYKDLAAAHGYLEWQLQIKKAQAKVFAIQEGSKTKFIFLAVERKQANKLVELLEKDDVTMEEVEWKEEIVNWQRPGLFSFKSIAQSIGTIGTTEADPTWTISIFFTLFFAFCLGDALYGLFIALFTGYFLRFKELKPGFKNIFSLFFYSSIITIIYGFLTNSWAGDLFYSDLWTNIFGSTTLNDFLLNFQILNIMDSESGALINDALGDTSPIIGLMGIALGLGFLNSLFAYYLKLRSSIKANDYKAALGQLSWVFFIFSIILWIVTLSIGGEANIISNSVLALGFISIFVFSEAQGFGQKIVGSLFGGRGLYGLVQLGAELMSYTRIVAIGLTSGVIASIINLLAFLLFDTGAVGIIFGLLLLLGGHIFNLVLSLFSAYINPLRLTYVEFMPKFFEGKGKQFRPDNPELSHVSLQV